MKEANLQALVNATFGGLIRFGVKLLTSSAMWQFSHNQVQVSHSGFSETGRTRALVTRSLGQFYYKLQHPHPCPCRSGGLG